MIRTKVGDAIVTYSKRAGKVDVVPMVPIRNEQALNIGKRTMQMTMGRDQFGRMFYQARVGSMSSALMFANAIYTASVFPELKECTLTPPF